MPHIRLETSFKNLDSSTLDACFSKLHQFICDHTQIELQDCKSRLFVSDYVYIGNKTIVTDFLFLEIIIFADRPQEFKQALGAYALQTLQQQFSTEIEKSGAKPAVRITEIARELFYN